MIKISIIVPVYNSAEYLEKCLDSILSQSLKDIEIICVDDGSTDNSLSILNKYAKEDRRIIVKTQPNSGQSVARNRALEIATGDFIGFVDSDDWIDADFYEKLYNTAIDNKADIASAGIKQETEKGSKNLVNYKKIKTNSNTYKKLQISYIPNYCYTWNKIYKTSKLKKHNLTFKEGMFYEDIIFSIMALHLLQKLVTVPKIFYHYRENLNSTVHTKTEKNNKDLNYAYDYIYDYANKHGFVIPEFCLKRDLTKTYYKIFKIVILKKLQWKRVTKFYLFGLIPVFEIRKEIYGGK